MTWEGVLIIGGLWIFMSLLGLGITGLEAESQHRKITRKEILGWIFWPVVAAAGGAFAILAIGLGIPLFGLYLVCKGAWDTGKVLINAK